MQGEIKVAELMAQAEADADRLRRWQERQRRNTEWEALKQWWAAQRAVRRATTIQERREAVAGLRQVAWLYHDALRRAWPKWQRVQRARAAGQIYSLPDGGGS